MGGRRRRKGVGAGVGSRGGGVEELLSMSFFSENATLKTKHCMT